MTKQLQKQIKSQLQDSSKTIAATRAQGKVLAEVVNEQNLRRSTQMGGTLE